MPPKHEPPTKIRCAQCGESHLVVRVVDHDVGALLDMESVLVKNLPAMVCPACKDVTVSGAALELISLELAAQFLRLSELAPTEVRFLRKLLGDTQEEFAKRLAVVRATVNRWENSTDPITGPDAYAIRSHAFFRLRSSSSSIEAAAPAFTDTNPPRPRRTKNYTIDGKNLTASAGL